MQTMPKGSDWIEWKNLVLHNQETQSKDIIEIKDGMAEIRSDIRLLKFQAGMWGAVVGFIVSSTITFMFAYLF